MKTYRNVPLLLVYYADPNRPSKSDSSQDFAANPQLSALGIYIDPDIVWQNISEYLSQLKSEAETSPSVPDKAKIGNKRPLQNPPKIPKFPPRHLGNFS